jgi:hypothetical protein
MGADGWAAGGAFEDLGVCLGPGGGVRLTAEEGTSCFAHLPGPGLVGESVPYDRRESVVVFGVLDDEGLFPVRELVSGRLLAD